MLWRRGENDPEGTQLHISSVISNTCSSKKMSMTFKMRGGMWQKVCERSGYNSKKYANCWKVNSCGVEISPASPLQVKCVLVKELFLLQIKLLRLIYKFPLPFQNNSNIMLMYQWQNIREGVRTGCGVWKYCLFRINVFKQYTCVYTYTHTYIKNT